MRRFAESRDLLHSDKDAISYYTEATISLKKHGLEKYFSKESQASNEGVQFPEPVRDRIVTLVLKGAKAQKLGIELRFKDRFTIEIYDSNGKQVTTDDFVLLSKTIAHLAELDLSQSNTERAMLLGAANLALGIQLSAFEVDFLRMYGIGCKFSGLQTLEKCTKNTNNKEMMKEIREMRSELERQFQRLKNAPPTMPYY